MSEPIKTDKADSVQRVVVWRNRVCLFAFSIGCLITSLSELEKDGWMRVYGPFLMGVGIGYLVGWILNAPDNARTMVRLKT